MKLAHATESLTTFRCDACGRLAVFTWSCDHSKTWLCSVGVSDGLCNGHMRYESEPDCPESEATK